MSRIDVRDLSPEEIAEALGWLAEQHDRNPVHRTKRHALALATLAARMLEEGPVAHMWRDWEGRVRLTPGPSKYERIGDLQLYAIPELTEPTP